MRNSVSKTRKDLHQMVVDEVSLKQSGGDSSYSFENSLPQALQTKGLQSAINISPRVTQLKTLQESIRNSPRMRGELPLFSSPGVSPVQQKKAMGADMPGTQKTHAPLQLQPEAASGSREAEMDMGRMHADAGKGGRNMKAFFGAEEEAHKRIANGRQLYNSPGGQQCTHRNVADLIWFVYNKGESKVSTSFKKNSLSIPDPEGTWWNWIRNSSISHTRGSTHVQGHRVSHEKGGTEGRGIDYDYLYEKEGNLPHHLKTVLFHTIEVNGTRKLFIKLETAGMGGTAEENKQRSWFKRFMPHERSVQHTKNWFSSAAQGKHSDEGMKAFRDKIPKGVEKAAKNWDNSYRKVAVPKSWGSTLSFGLWKPATEVANVKDKRFGHIRNMSGSRDSISKFSQAIARQLSEHSELCNKNPERRKELLALYNPTVAYLKEIRNLPMFRDGGSDTTKEPLESAVKSGDPARIKGAYEALIGIWRSTLEASFGMIGEEIDLSEDELRSEPQAEAPEELGHWGSQQY